MHRPRCVPFDFDIKANSGRFFITYQTYGRSLQAIVDFTELRAEKMRFEMSQARRAERREEWRAEMERERLDLER